MFKVNESNNFDVVVIGGGPGGYVAAIWLAKAGVNTCIVEGHKFGGTCLNYGCIPTKSLYHYAKTIQSIQEHQEIGIKTSEPIIDLSKIMEQKEATVETLVNGVATLVAKNKITIKHGFASFLDDYHIKVVDDTKNEEVIKGRHIIIASGSTPILPPIKGLKDGLEDGFVLTSKEALELKAIPKELVIIGGGVIGMEFATIYNQFGSKVTVLEATDSLLPSFNKELVKRYKPLAKKQGIKVQTGALVTKVRSNDDKAVVSYSTKKGDIDIQADLVICAVGRKPKFDHLNLSALSRQINDDRKVMVNDFMVTDLKHIFGIGDVNGLSLLAHSASKQGIIAATQIINQLSGFNKDIKKQLSPKGFSTYAIPQVAFLLPEICQTGISEDTDKSKVSTGKFAYRSNGMALASHSTDGICKVEYNESKEQLTYMGILGDTSSELIQIGVHMIDQKSDYNDLVDGLVGHPSLNEVLHEALLDLHKMGIHQL